MSDLQCPATLLCARSGEVRSVEGGVSSVGGGELTDKGRGQVHRLVEQVRSRRVAAVYSSAMGRAIESAELAAAQLGLRPVVVDGLRGFLSGDLAPASFEGAQTQLVHDARLLGELDLGRLEIEDADRLVERFSVAIGEIADTHRGETVLVFTHGGPISLAIPRLAVNVRHERAEQRLLPHCAVVEVEVDGDGWRLVSWPSVTNGHMI